MKGIFKAIRNQLIAGVVLFTCIGIGYAVDIPHLFSPDTPAKSSEVNANFNSLKASVDALEVKVNALGSNLPLPAKNGKLGYAVVGLDGTLLPNYSSFNSTGGAIQVNRFGAGNYEVTFMGLGDASEPPPPAQGNIQVTPLMPGFYCSAAIDTGLVSPANVKARVICFDSSGRWQDAAFSILLIN